MFGEVADEVLVNRTLQYKATGNENGTGQVAWQILTMGRSRTAFVKGLMLAGKRNVNSSRLLRDEIEEGGGLPFPPPYSPV
jgi:hypothetical protein